MVSWWVGLDRQNERFSEAQSIGNSPLIRWGPRTTCPSGRFSTDPASLFNPHNNLKRRMTTTTG